MESTLKKTALGLFLVFVFGFLYYQKTRPVQLHIIEITNSHAEERHGQDATDAKRCLEEYGSTMTYREKQSGFLHFLCFNPKSRLWYDVIVVGTFAKEGINKVSQLITAYSPSRQFQSIQAYIEFLSTNEKYLAVVSKYYIVAHDIYFMPKR